MVTPALGHHYDLRQKFHLAPCPDFPSHLCCRIVLARPFKSKLEFARKLPPLVVMTSPALIIACDWIPPAFGAVGQYQLARAREAAASGRATTLIGLGDVASVTTERHGWGSDAATLTIVRLAAKGPDKKNLLARAFWALSINVKLLGAVVRAASPHRDVEIKVTGSPPFFSYLVIVWNSLFLRRSVTYRITDFYPETAFAAGQAQVLRPLAPLIHALRRRADRIEALSGCQKRRLLGSGMPAERIAIVRDDAPVSFSAATVPAQRPFDLADLVVLYSGNFGVAHDVDTFAQAYRRHIQDGANRVRLWLNATGVNAPKLTEFCRRHDLPVHASPPVPLNDLAGVLCAADMHLVTLGAPFWGYVIPSKIYGCIESGRPVLYVGPAESDIHELIGDDPRSVSVRNGDVEACFQALEALAAGVGATPSA